MARINTREGRDAERSGGLLPKGTYLSEIQPDVTEKTNADGHPYFKVNWKVVEGKHAGRFLCTAVIMLGGKGFGIGMVILRVLGFDVDSGDDLNVEAPELVGRRALVTVDVHEYTKSDGSKGVSLRPTGDSKSGFGYASVRGLEPEVSGSKDDDIPF